MTTATQPVRPPSMLGELLARYRAVLGAAWAARKQLDSPPRAADELAFLPAAMSLQETPVHPAPRRTAIAVCVLFAAALAWSVIGEVDIVAVAQGRIVVSERTKTIQPLEAGVVRSVLVRDGDDVRAGQILIELDATTASADDTSVKEQLKAVDAELARSRALLDALASGRVPALPAGAADAALRSQLQAEWSDIAAKLAKLDAEQSRRQAEGATAHQLVAKLQATLPIVKRREDDLQSLTG